MIKLEVRGLSVSETRYMLMYIDDRMKSVGDIRHKNQADVRV